MMTRGFLATGWMTALVESGCPNPERRMNTLQTMVWDEYAFPMWAQRNEILHQSKQTDEYHREEDNRLAAKITWYQQHRRELLSHHDQWLAKQDLTTLHRKRRATKREWIRILDKAREAYDNELNQLASSQNVITRYFQSTSIPSATHSTTTDHESGNQEQLNNNVPTQHH